MEELEELITLLYTPGMSPDVVRNAQKSLQVAQKSSKGWELAQSLLSSKNPQAQFLGAQTFIVKLNEGSNLPTPEQQHRDLLGWLEYAVSHNFAPFVIRKLLGAITKLYLSNNMWPSCPLEVVQILGPSSGLTFEFVNFLVEDPEMTTSTMRAKLVPEVSNFVLDLLKGVQLSSIESVKTLERWSLTFFDQFTQMIGDLISIASVSFNNHVQSEPTELELTVTALDALGNIYFHDWRSWPPLALRQLTEMLINMVQSYTVIPPPHFSEDELFLSLAGLIITVCQEDFESNVELHPFLIQVAATSEPVVNDPLAVETLEFWNQYCEEIISVCLTSTSPSANHSKNVIASVISGYWPRIKLYPDLSASDWEEFSSFRKDFADFIELSYPIMGSQLFEHLTDIVLSALASQPHIDWLSIESGLYCLNGLSEIIGEDYRGQKPEFQSIQRIFQSDLWMVLPQCENYRVRQTAVNLIGCFVDFFLSAEGRPYLAVILNYLFNCLDSEALQNTASRSIQRLCDTCQDELLDEIPAFLSIYSQIRSKLRSVPHIRTVGGIACVAQALKNPADKAQAVLQLLDLAITATPADPTVDPIEVQQTRLKCVAIIGKNIHATEAPSQSSSLEAATPDSISSIYAFWGSNPIAMQIKNRLRDIINNSMQMVDVTSIEAVCEIVKAGITNEPGPFYLDEQFAISFVVSKCQVGPSLAIAPLLDLAKFYVISRLASARQRKAPNMSSEEVAPLVSLINQFGPVSVSSALDLLTRIVGVAASHDMPFVQLVPGIRQSIDIGVHGMQSSDRFILRSATAFWKEFLASSISVTSNSGSTDSPTLDSETGEKLIRILLAQISGAASRSDLGPITDVVKILISKHPLITSQFLKQFVVSSPEESNIASQDVKTRSDFVSQLMLVKGGRKTSEIVQRFWQKCRGIPETYDPHPTILN